MARNHAIFIAALLGLSGLSTMARAQSCEDDFDCVSGKWCQGDGGDVATGPSSEADEAPVCDGNGCPEPEPEPSPSVRTCQPLPKGLCVDQTDCTTGLTCEISTIGSECAEPAPAEPGQRPVDAKDDCTSSQQPAPYGYCTLPETKCTTDAQCLPGLKCVESSGSDGGVSIARPACNPESPDCGRDPLPEPEPEPAEQESTCEVAFDDCTSNTQCRAGYECVEKEVGCSSSGSAGSSGGGSTDPVPPTEIDKQNDPECETESKCFPTFVACDTDAQCQANWVCYAYEADGVGRLWDKETAGKACLPKGLALAAEAAAAADKGSRDGVATGAPESANDSNKAGSGSSSNCALGLGEPAQGMAWFFAMALGLIVRRRRV